MEQLGRVVSVSTKEKRFIIISCIILQSYPELQLKARSCEDQGVDLFFKCVFSPLKAEESVNNLM